MDSNHVNSEVKKIVSKLNTSYGNDCNCANCQVVIKLDDDNYGKFVMYNKMFCSKDCQIKFINNAKFDKRKNSHTEYAKSIGVGLRFIGATFDNFSGIEKLSIKDKLHNLDKNILIQSKQTGNGKTHLAVAIVKGYGLLDAGEHHFVNFSELMMDIRHSFKLDTMQEKEIIKKYSSYKMLVIDDIGAEKTSEYAISVLYLILNKRYESMLPTVTTTNMTAQQIIDSYGQRILSRMMGNIIKLGGEDRRISK